MLRIFQISKILKQNLFFQFQVEFFISLPIQFFIIEYFLQIIKDLRIKAHIIIIHGPELLEHTSCSWTCHSVRNKLILKNSRRKKKKSTGNKQAGRQDYQKKKNKSLKKAKK